MEMLQIIFLGIIQGIAEFLPISSSAHLIIFRDLFHVASNMSNETALIFDIALHFGTFLAIVVYFFKDFLTMILNGFIKGPKHKEGKLMWLIIVSTIPAAICGILFESTIENLIRTNYFLIALSLLIVGIIIYLIDSKAKNIKTISEITYKDALIIGCTQILALIPGFSRSGTTIASGRACQLNREASAKFSFYLSAPIILGAFTVTLIKDNTIGIVLSNLPLFIIGMASSFMVGLICIAFLLKYLRNHDFKLFMWYRIALAVAVMLIISFR